MRVYAKKNPPSQNIRFILYLYHNKCNIALTLTLRSTPAEPNAFLHDSSSSSSSSSIVETGGADSRFVSRGIHSFSHSVHPSTYPSVHQSFITHHPSFIIRLYTLADSRDPTGTGIQPYISCVYINPRSLKPQRCKEPGSAPPSLSPPPLYLVRPSYSSLTSQHNRPYARAALRVAESLIVCRAGVYPGSRRLGLESLGRGLS
ncbi:hypothetical protein F5Y14DRAFT_346759 [Nemania sp. NC0429]|nr:hypothetical protein F5Y14DRAFT_346759 [Nemania sp. NC0429]